MKGLGREEQIVVRTQLVTRKVNLADSSFRAEHSIAGLCLLVNLICGSKPAANESQETRARASMLTQIVVEFKYLQTAVFPHIGIAVVRATEQRMHVLDRLRTLSHAPLPRYICKKILISTTKQVFPRLPSKQSEKS